MTSKESIITTSPNKAEERELPELPVGLSAFALPAVGEKDYGILKNSAEEIVQSVNEFLSMLNSQGAEIIHTFPFEAAQKDGREIKRQMVIVKKTGK